MQYTTIAFRVLALLAIATSVPAAETPTTRPIIKVQIPATTVEIQLVRIPAGAITMPPDDEHREAREVHVKSIWFATTETTWDEFGIWAFGRDLAPAQHAAAVAAGQRPPPQAGAPDRDFGYDGFPAIGMTVKASKLYCQWLSAKTGRKFRVPTEPEWEYACRCAGPAIKPMPEVFAERVSAIAWWLEDSGETTHRVAEKQPNAWGLYDMLGNAAEWVDTPADSTPFVKGGGFRSSLKRIESAGRQYQKPDWAARDPANPWFLSDAPFVGFRVVCEE